jgi:hypothetical protein
MSSLPADTDRMAHAMAYAMAHEMAKGIQTAGKVINAKTIA